MGTAVDRGHRRGAGRRPQRRQATSPPRQATPRARVPQARVRIQQVDPRSSERRCPVITDDEIMRLFEQADPARNDGVQMVDAAGYLDALRTRSYDMQLIDTTEAPTKTPRDT